MKLFQMEVRRGRKGGRVVLAHFPTRDEALEHVQKVFAGSEIRNVVEITQRAHFEIADGDGE